MKKKTSARWRLGDDLVTPRRADGGDADLGPVDAGHLGQDVGDRIGGLDRCPARPGPARCPGRRSGSWRSPAPTAPSASRASATLRPGAGTSHEVPPSKSMPRFRRPDAERADADDDAR